MVFAARPVQRPERRHQIVSQVLREWECAAACRGMDPELFFDRPARSREVLAAACAGCPVVGLCVSGMIGSNTDRKPLIYGYWGGVNADTVSGKMRAYITAIASNAVSSPAGDEVAYLATRFLMEHLDGSDNDEIPDSSFDDFKATLRIAAIRRLTDAIDSILSSSDQCDMSEYPRSLVRRIDELLSSGFGASPRSRTC